MQSLDLIGPLEVFTMANRFGEATLYDVLLASPEGGAIQCSSGIALALSAALTELPPDLDTILVGGGSEDEMKRASSGELLSWLNDRATYTRRVGSVCSGAFLLAAAGLLDGRRATTHWDYCDRLRALRPDVLIEPDAIFVADPPFYTSAGITAGIDLCLSLVEADHGPKLALSIARNLVFFLRRPGGQTQYSTGLTAQAAVTPKLRQLLADISADPTGDLSVPKLAEQVAMTERTFARIFNRETGVGPATFIELARLNRAKALLETSDCSLARVADRSGFGTTECLRRAFNKRFGITPGEYRERFNHSGSS